MINFKQQQLIDELFLKTKKRFPKIKFLNVSHSPEDPSDLWINVLARMSEDEEIKMREYSAKITTKILDKYGYLILLMSERPKYIRKKKARKKSDIT